jgi:hypothetical protein
LHAELQGTRTELQETKEKLENDYKDVDAAGGDAYRDCVKPLKFLNPGITLNIRVLDKYHGVKGVRFWNFRDYNNPIPLDPPNPNLQPFD